MNYFEVATDIKKQAEDKINQTIVQKEVELLMPKLLDLFQHKVDNEKYSIKKVMGSNIYMYEIEVVFGGTYLGIAELFGTIIHKPKYALNEQFFYVLKEVESIFNKIDGYKAECYVNGLNYYLHIILEVTKDNK